MGKSLNGKELGKGLSQRKDGLYQGRFVNRFGKKQTVYAKTLNEVRQKLRNEQYEDEKALNVVAKDTFYYNLYVVAIDTGMRIGELMGLQWSDVDFEKKVVHVRRSLCYFRKDGKYVFEWQYHFDKDTNEIWFNVLQSDSSDSAEFVIPMQLGGDKQSVTFLNKTYKIAQ